MVAKLMIFFYILSFILHNTILGYKFLGTLHAFLCERHGVFKYSSMEYGGFMKKLITFVVAS